MPVVRHRSALRLFALAASFACAAWACARLLPLEINGPTSGTYSIQVGEPLDFHMQAAGPGSYVSPPAMAGSGLQFLGVSAGPTTPGGIAQIFHFKGTASGTTIIAFSGDNTAGSTLSIVVDTVYVR